MFCNIHVHFHLQHKVIYNIFTRYNLHVLYVHWRMTLHASHVNKKFRELFSPHAGCLGWYQIHQYTTYVSVEAQT